MTIKVGMRRRGAALHQLARYRELPHLAMHWFVTFVSFDDGFNLKRLSTALQRRHAFRAHRPVAAAHLGGPAAVARGAVGIAKRQCPGLVANLARGEDGLGVVDRKSTRMNSRH